jgi:hypothetical protein
MSQTSPASLEPAYTIRHGISRNQLTKPCQTFAEAEKQAKRLSVEASHTVEIWNLDKFMCWYLRGEKG